MSDYEIIDVHSHILPGIDDGARDMEESIALLCSAYEQDVRRVIATPHYSRHRTTEHLKEQYEALLGEVREELAKVHPDMKLYLGMELLHHEELIDRLRQGYGWSLNHSRHYLIEFDTSADYPTIRRGLRRIREYGGVPVLAHIERFPSIHEEKKLRELKSDGALLQMNYETITFTRGLRAMFDPEARFIRMALKGGYIDFLGSDMHRADTRPCDAQKGLEALRGILKEEEIRRLVCDNPKKHFRLEE